MIEPPECGNHPQEPITDPGILTSRAAVKP